MQVANGGRRGFLVKAGVVSASLFNPAPFALVWAQHSDGALRLLRLPKIALVIGNGDYKDAPVLKNPLNDAAAIADVLRQTGFQVTLVQNAPRPQMVASLQAYTAALASKKCVGLFYFAGHGLQLAWRNYLLPVDAGIDRIGDVAKQGVDVGGLMESLGKASNAMNMVILDACRENPFGKDSGPEHKGLSQMDAPPSTLLAYATSPGNVASDGTGAHGLYTENLLREIRVKDAKIEDVFKRVRLAVRRKSNGEQIPWESTSLEDDFYFLPPENLRKLSEAEREQLFKEEAAIWDRARNATALAPVEDYLRRYPNGNFSEVAQLKLDRMLAQQGEKPIAVAPASGNPYTKGSASADSRYTVGDTYSYRTIDTLTKVVADRPVIHTVRQVSDDKVFFESGLVTDLLGNELEFSNGMKLSAAQRYPLEYSVGKRWSTRYTEVSPRGGVGQVLFELHVAARETITVPAGSFNAFRIEGIGHVNYPGMYMSAALKLWVAPDQVRRPVATELFRKNNFRILVSDRNELVSFRQA
ncbi:MAG: hypothetical protein JWP36_77 [Paucimonas sp.]|nr:hypothetical protein [Paucimonas sp.]